MWPAERGRVDMAGRELRGAAVDLNTGTLVARPYRKFWGAKQHADAQLSSNMSKAMEMGSGVTEKVDGSLIFGVPVGEQVVLATKIGFTQVARMAQELRRSMLTAEQMRGMMIC